MDHSREALLAELCTIDLLIIDDFALEPMARDESRDVYQLFVERSGRASTVVTSNRDTAEWLAVFDDALLARSAVDCFRNSAYDIVVDRESYRARLKPTVLPRTLRSPRAPSRSDPPDDDATSSPDRERRPPTGGLWSALDEPHAPCDFSHGLRVRTRPHHPGESVAP